MIGTSVWTKLLRAALVLVLLCGVIAATPARNVGAYNICGDIFIFYYSDASHSHLVGGCTIPCGVGKETCWGKTTQYSKQISECHAC
jgi:hypothetical protein